MARAKLEMERALIHLGPMLMAWFWALEDNCECGVTPTVGVLELYRCLASMSKQCDSMFNNFEERAKEPLVQIRKRGSRRGRCPNNWLDWKGSLHLTPEPELPHIVHAPKGESATNDSSTT